MRFVTYLENGAEKLGVVWEEKIYELSEVGLPYKTMEALIEGYTAAGKALLEKALAAPQAGGISLSRAKLAAPIPRPRHDLICVGQNYVEHAKEVARFRGNSYEVPEYPCFFSKRAHHALGQGDVINPHFDINDSLDYEVELAVIIGTKCDHVAPQNAYNHIFGYTIANDVSARTIQKRHGGQYYLGKSLEGFSPMGPWIVTADEFSAPPNLQLSTTVNGEVRQFSNTSDFIFDIPRLISELSAGIVLYPGDIILTGTPSGVAMGFDPPKFLKGGDVVECEIEGIGVLRNIIG